MAKDYRSTDRDQPFLLPPDMRDWLPKDHVVWFILEVTDGFDLSVLHEKSKRGGTGRKGYDPKMLFALWLYATARGIRSSREIERLCSQDIGFRVVCAQDAPDHTVVAKFRQRHEDAIADLFAQVLLLCTGHGLGQFGVIAIDGTKIKANASKDKTHTLKKLRQYAADELKKAADTDAAEDAAGARTAHEDLPPGFEPGTDRAKRIREAIKDLESVIEEDNGPDIQKFVKRVEKSETKLTKVLARTDELQTEYDDAVAEGRPPGRVPKTETYRIAQARHGVEHNKKLLEKAKKAVDDQVSGEVARTRRTNKLLQRNITDPQARIMITKDGFRVAYNGQLAVLDGQLILAAEVTADPNDRQQLVPMMDKSKEAIEMLRAKTDRTDLGDDPVIAVDNGYLSAENVAADGYDRLIAPGRGMMKDGKWVGKIAGREGAKMSDAAQTMITKLQIPGNQEIYNRRSQIVEPVNAFIKDRRGLRQFSRRGLKAVDAEFKMAAMTTNLMKLFTTVWQPATTAT